MVEHGNGSWLERIKKELKDQDPRVYKKWKENDFSISYRFPIVDDTASFEADLSFLASGDLKELLLKSANSQRISDSLIFATVSNCFRTVRRLVKKSAGLNVKSMISKTPLHWATINNCPKIVKYLIKKGAKLDVQDDMGRTPLHLAAERGHTEVVKALIKARARFDVQDNMGSTPLLLAITFRKRGIAESLVAHEIKLRGSSVQKPGYLVQSNSNLKREISECWNECFQEIKMMEQEKAGIFYDILTARNDRLMSHILRAKVALDKVGYRELFPMYADQIENQRSKLEKRKDLLEEGSRNLREVFTRGITKSIYNKASDEAYEKIAEHLDDLHLEKLNGETNKWMAQL